MKYCVDNAAMIAGLGVKLLEAGRRDDLTLAAAPTTAC
jgi:tRNA A37 threonylcarbamoyltransferase TsaD